MSLAAFENYIQTVPPSVDIHFSGFSEPWHAPDCVDMIRMAHNQGHKVAVFTTADRMMPDHISRLSHIPFKRFVVHLPDAGGEMRMCPNEAYVELIQMLARNQIQNTEFLTLGIAHPRIVKAIGYTASTRRVHTRAGNVHLTSTTVGAAFTQNEILALTKDTSLVCRGDRMFSNILLPNGDVQFCSMDYNLEHRLGNLGEQTYTDIMNSRNFARVFELLSDPASEILCRRCEYALPGQYHRRS
jgi:radical SAM protein with 4Fe4S-binding SPASM domain